jgi:hypothetical protein
MVMVEAWLEIEDEGLDALEIQHRVEERMSRREAALSEGEVDPGSLAASLFEERFGGLMEEGPASDLLLSLQYDFDVVPRSYVIDWRVPILGPIHALIRRVINAEIRRYVLPMLQKQSHLNRQLVKEVTGLRQENAALREELDRLCVGEAGVPE